MDTNLDDQKEAETHLPELEARDGISIAMEDIGTSRVWNMRYRYFTMNFRYIHSIFHDQFYQQNK